MDENVLKYKRYFTMGEVTEMLNVNASLIRFWHKEFSEFLHPKTNKKGNRLFTPKDVETLQKIYYLVREKGYTLEGAKKELCNNQTTKSSNETITNTSIEEIKEKLLKIRSELLLLKDIL
ncbi:transcriptional regulator [Thermaurantimonas aggregans]|uniref:Transcriptional regulator n=1 Tax=Thermaurantimonas aggregans TaxID=2173829 RepID=A0A401XNX7_9FLAO|nr:MerR family transcriptional regulator [Thermaurantimonas aggregans]MCX8149489.1 MerR family transcriptional regulator [Thermaurantimonas aggregans]GCD78663.1 transcriptional regulator [Thermaurantimonas aggregans]